MNGPPVVAVVNTNPDLVELLKARIEQAGFVVLVVIHIAEIRSGLDLGAVLSQHDPKVIVYDVVAPLERNWRFLEHLRSTPAFQNRRLVLTTPNADVCGDSWERTKRSTRFSTTAVMSTRSCRRYGKRQRRGPRADE